MKPFVTVMDIAQDLDITRQRVHEIIKDFDLKYSKVGNMLLIDKESYQAYLKLRKRRDLAKAAGRKENKFIYDPAVDTICPNCGNYAVLWKGVFACENGHRYNQA